MKVKSFVESSFCQMKFVFTIFLFLLYSCSQKTTRIYTLADYRIPSNADINYDLGTELEAIGAQLTYNKVPIIKIKEKNRYLVEELLRSYASLPNKTMKTDYPNEEADTVKAVKGDSLKEEVNPKRQINDRVKIRPRSKDNK